jgi:acetyl-CoA acetyltransferase
VYSKLSSIKYPASSICLEKAGLTLDDMDIYEVNEAFAPIPLAWAKTVKSDMEKLIFYFNRF